MHAYLVLLSLHRETKVEADEILRVDISLTDHCIAVPR